MHLLVLSAFRPIIVGPDGIVVWGSQCTFWCSVLSDNENPKSCPRHDWVSMHLLVLSAFRLLAATCVRIPTVNVSMHLLVLSAFRQGVVCAYVYSF